MATKKGDTKSKAAKYAWTAKEKYQSATVVISVDGKKVLVGKDNLTDAYAKTILTSYAKYAHLIRKAGEIEPVEPKPVAPWHKQVNIEKYIEGKKIGEQFAREFFHIVCADRRISKAEITPTLQKELAIAKRSMDYCENRFTDFVNNGGTNYYHSKDLGRARDYYYYLQNFINMQYAVIEAKEDKPKDVKLRDFFAKGKEGDKEYNRVITAFESAFVGKTKLKTIVKDKAKCVVATQQVLEAKGIIAEGSKTDFTTALGRHWCETYSPGGNNSAEQSPLLNSFKRKFEAAYDAAKNECINTLKIQYTLQA